MTVSATEWPLWSTLARLVVTETRALAPARALVEEYLAEVDGAANRFRPDSEIRTLRRDADDCVTLSPVLADLVRHALDAAELTDGDVDPTVGTALLGLGYDRDISLVIADRGPWRAVVRPVPGWRQVHLTGRILRLPRGVTLDLGATAKAVAADRSAEIVRDRLGVGVLVGLGGDIATAGPSPSGGWQVHVQDRADDPSTQVALPAGGAIATSSIVSRQWVRGERVLHHIVDPFTGLPALTPWRSVTVAAGTCVQANTLTTAALVRGRRAVRWIESLCMPARFLGRDGHVVLTGGWPEDVAA